MSEQPLCEICGEPMPESEQMFKYHGASGPCPKPPLPRAPHCHRSLPARRGGRAKDQCSCGCDVWRANPMNDTASAAPSEREQFERHVTAYTGRDMEYHERNGTTGLEFGWTCWQAARRAQPTPPAVVEPLTDEQISRISRSVLEAPAADGVALDAARYRMLRRGQHWSVINGVGDTLRAEELDAAIDAARAQSKEGGAA